MGTRDNGEPGGFHARPGSILFESSLVGLAFVGLAVIARLERHDAVSLLLVATGAVLVLSTHRSRAAEMLPCAVSAVAVRGAVPGSTPHQVSVVSARATHPWSYPPARPGDRRRHGPPGRRR